MDAGFVLESLFSAAPINRSNNALLHAFLACNFVAAFGCTHSSIG